MLEGVSTLPMLAEPELSERATASDTVQWLRRWTGGDRAAGERVFRHLYAELHRLASRIRRGEAAAHTLQTTALVNELYLRLADKRRVDWQDRAQFFAIAARLLRQILVDQARVRLADKRGQGRATVPLHELDDVALPAADDSLDDAALLRVDACLSRMRQEDPSAAELIELRYFAGLSLEQTAAVLDCSRATLVRRWRLVKGRLQRLLAG